LVDYFGRAIRRTASLILLGILVDSTVNRAWTPGLGVLQIIGLAYFVGALLSPLPVLWRAAVSLLLLAGHSWLLLAWPVPGFGAGRVTETTNAVAFLNEIYLAPWGIKGLISAIPTAGMVLIGSVFGELFQRRQYPIPQRSLLVLLGGAALTASGYAASLFLPMNKPLWTASYILFTAGLGAILLAVLHFVVDSTKFGTKFAFLLLVPGANAITGYVAPILIKINVLQGWTVMTSAGRTTVESALQNTCYAAAGRVNGGWLYTLGYIAVWWTFLYYLYRKQWFLRV
jgi:predicted acyltransferase